MRAASLRIVSFLAVVVQCLAWSLVPRLSAQDLSALDSVPPVKVDGSISLSLVGTATEDTLYPRQPFTWLVSGAVTPVLYGVQVPITFQISREESALYQPFNQFGLSPSYGPVTAHLGYRSMTFGRYTLAGITFLGAGVEATPGDLRLGAMVGRFQRAVQRDTNRPDIIPAYDRYGYAFKLGYGDQENYVDISLLRAADDTLSLARLGEIAEPPPQENTAVGMAMALSIIPELSFEGEVGASLLTRDRTARSFSDDSTSIPAFLSSIQPILSSTTLTLAGRASLNLTLPTFGLRLGYERVEPDYNSLGAYYFATDFENWTIAPSLTLFDNQLRLSGSVGLQHDNLLDQRLATTERVIGSANIGWNPSALFGVEAGFSNYSTGQAGGSLPLNDSIAARSVSRTLTITPHLSFLGEEINHLITLSAGRQLYTDLNRYPGSLNNTDATTLSLFYSLVLPKEGVSLGASVLVSNAGTAFGETNMTGGSINGSIGLLENRLTLGASLGLAHTTTTIVTPTLPSAMSWNEGLTASFRFDDLDNLSLSLYAVQGGTAASVTGQLGYTRSFSWTP